MTVKEKQISILKDAKKYIYEKINNKFKNKLSVLLYLNSWDPSTLGYSYLKWKISSEKSFFWFTRRFIKNLLAVRNYQNLELYNYNQNSRCTNYTTLIVSWCKISDFDEFGNFFDRYFNCDSKKYTNIIWLLVSLDNILPPVLNKDIIIYYSHKKSILSSTLFATNYFFKSVKASLINKKNNSIVDISPEKIFAEKISEIVNELNYKFTLKSVIQPYEAQPFQHAINLILKKAKNRINLIGYLHSVLPALPTDLIFREGAPEVLFVHGIGQIEILNNFLNWNINSLKFTPSIRYKKKITDSFSDSIFLPYNFNDSKRILFELETYFASLPDFNLPNMKIRCHPAKASSKKHIKLVRNINLLLSKYIKKFNINIENKISIFIGGTAAIVEALERNVEVIHITSDPIFESHQNLIWKHLNVNSITNYTFKYSLIKSSSYIYLGDNDDTILKLIL